MKNDFKEFINGFKAMFTDLKTKEGRRKQVPNWITFSRLVLSCFIPPLAMSGNLIALGWASGLAVVALGTDFVDGKLARKLDAVSEFGKNLDPVCDKLAAAILLAPLILKSSPLSPWLYVEGVNVIYDKITSFNGDEYLESISTINQTYACDGAFIALDTQSSYTFAMHLGIGLNGNDIIVDSNMMTNLSGVFAGGDCIGGLKQIVKAAWDGAIAAIAINKYLKENK